MSMLTSYPDLGLGCLLLALLRFFGSVRRLLNAVLRSFTSQNGNPCLHMTRDRRHARMMEPPVNPTKNKFLMTLLCEFLNLLVRVMTGHALLRKHLSQWHVLRHPDCQFREKEEEVPCHLFFNCSAPLLEQHRNGRWDQYDPTTTACSFPTYFMSKRLAKAFADVLNESTVGKEPKLLQGASKTDPAGGPYWRS